MSSYLLDTTLAVSLATGLLFGLVPALRWSRVDVHQTLKGARTISGHLSRQRVLTALVTGELALAFVLVFGVGLLGNSYLRIMNVNPGYDAYNVVTLSMLPDLVHYATDESRLRYFDTVVERMRTIPGVETVGYASTLPLSHPDARRLYIYERPNPSDADAPNLDTYFVSADYFDVMRIPLLHGQGFSERDRRGAGPVAVVSESCVRTQFRGEDPIGKHVQVGRIRDGRKPWARIVGVVGDVHQYGLDRKPDAAVYLVFAQAEEVQQWASLVVRSKIGAEPIEPAVRATLKAVDALQPLFHVQALEAYIGKSLAQRTFTLAVIGLFGSLALALATMGIYGVISYTVGMRTREMGIRIALGARPGDVVGMILRQVLGIALAGLTLGVAGSLACTRILANLLFGVGPMDLPTTLSVAALVIAIALAASYVPARRAANVDPTTALRVE